VTLNVHEFGPADGLPVLCLHGVTGHALRWRVVSEALPELRLVAVDLRGHGYSPWTPPWSIDQHVADALAVLDERGLRRVPVIGHSYGGAIAVHLARTARERVGRLALLDPAIGLDPERMRAEAEESRRNDGFPDRETARADRAANWEGISDELVDRELDEHLVHDGDRWRYRYDPSAVVVAWSEMARPAVTPPTGLPTLLLPAKRADYVQPAWVQACEEALGGALTVVEVDAGHSLQLERTAEVAELLRTFLGDADPE